MRKVKPFHLHLSNTFRFRLFKSSLARQLNLVRIKIIIIYNIVEPRLISAPHCSLIVGSMESAGVGRLRPRRPPSLSAGCCCCLMGGGGREEGTGLHSISQTFSGLLNFFPQKCTKENLSLSSAFSSPDDKSLEMLINRRKICFSHACPSKIFCCICRFFDLWI